MHPFLPPDLSAEMAESSGVTTLPRLSVVMATYNGAAFLQPQLRSLAEQQLLPTELVCLDDASTDNTVDLLREFARTAPFTVHITTRTVNVGPNRNFDEAIRRATGDVVLCCDQDDVWRPQKLARVAAAFGRDPRLGLLLNDAAIVRRDLKDAGQTLWQVRGFDSALQQRARAGESFEVFSQHMPPYGCTMSFRTSLVPLIPEVPDGATFDLWFGRMLSVLTRCDFIDEPLQLYRQHAEQVTGFEMRTIRGKVRTLRRQAGLEVLIIGLERTEQTRRAVRAFDPQTERARAALRWLEQRAAFDQARLELRSRGIAGLPALVGLLARGRYRAVSNGWRSALVDLVGLLHPYVKRQP